MNKDNLVKVTTLAELRKNIKPNQYDKLVEVCDYLMANGKTTEEFISDKLKSYDADNEGTRKY